MPNYDGSPLGEYEPPEFPIPETPFKGAIAFRAGFNAMCRVVK